MIFLLLALLSSFSIALMLRWVEERNFSRLVVIVSNYVTATILALGGGSRGYSDLPMDVLFVGIGLGVLFLAGFLVFSRAMRREGMAAAVTMGRISLIIPVAAAVVLFRESPGVLDVVALILVLTVLWVWEGGQRRVAPVLLLLFVLFGGISATMKWFATVHPAFPESRFLALVFGAALVCGGLVVAWKKRRVSGAAVGVGLILGIPNYYSSFFLVRALERMPAFVVFPVVDTGVIVLSAIAGALVFRERPDRHRLACMGLAVLALVLLGLSRGSV